MIKYQIAIIIYLLQLPRDAYNIFKIVKAQLQVLIGMDSIQDNTCQTNTTQFVSSVGHQTVRYMLDR